MYPVYGVAINHTAGRSVTSPFMSVEVALWLMDHELEDEGEDWAFDNHRNGYADFYFTDVNVALLFKLTWG